MNDALALTMPAPVIGAECCGLCKFVWSHPDGSARCRRHPPVALILASRTPEGKVSHVGTMSDWPPVATDQICGEFKRRVLVN